MRAERLMLRSFGFVVHVEQPHRFVLTYAQVSARGARTAKFHGRQAPGGPAGQHLGAGPHAGGSSCAGQHCIRRAAPAVATLGSAQKSALQP